MAFKCDNGRGQGVATPRSIMGPAAGQAGSDAVGSSLLWLGWGDVCYSQQGGGIFGMLLGSCWC